MKQIYTPCDEGTKTSFLLQPVVDGAELDQVMFSTTDVVHEKLAKT